MNRKNEVLRIIERWERGDQLIADDARAVEAALGDHRLDPAIRALLACIRRDVKDPKPIEYGTPDSVTVESVMNALRPVPTQASCVDRFARIATAVGAAAAGIALLIGSITLLVHVSSLHGSAGGVAANITEEESDIYIVVEFELYAPEANTVSLVGDFNDWNPARDSFVDPEGGGAWKAQIRVRPGEIYTYNFLINGEEWVPDPNAVRQVRDSFGGVKSVLSL